MFPDEVQTLIANLDERIKNDPTVGPSLFDELLSMQRELGLLHGTRPTCPFLRPHFLSRKQYQEIANVSEVISSAFERLAKAALQDKKLLSELGLTEKEERMARMEPGYDALCVTSRLDSFLSEDGFKFLEYNAETPAGIADQMQLEKVLMRVPAVRDFLKENKHWLPKPHEKLLESLLAAYRESGGNEERPQIGIVDWKGVSTESEFFVLRDYFESRGFPTIVADPRELEFEDDALYANGFRIDIFYKRVIIHEFLGRFDDNHPLVKAYKAGRVCMANSFRSKLVHKKAGFAVLCDPRYARLFTKEQQEMIRRHIPWTRRVREGHTTFENKEIDLLTVLRKERERFVLKPNDDYGGKGIFIGWETDQPTWENALNDALAHDYVAQERVRIKKIKLPMFSDKLEIAELLVDCNPFLFPNGVEGALVRISSSSLVNITQGGGQTALVIMEVN
jgi:uncharacterized circularly permuted ATP-grasp superfamily protein